MNGIGELLAWPEVFMVFAKEVGEPPELIDGWQLCFASGVLSEVEECVSRLTAAWPLAHLFPLGLHPVIGIRILGDGWERIPHMLMTETMRNGLWRGPLHRTACSAYVHVTTVPGGTVAPAFPTSLTNSPCTQEEFFREYRLNARTASVPSVRKSRSRHGRRSEPSSYLD